MAGYISALKSRLVGQSSVGSGQLGLIDRLFLLLWHYLPLPLIGLGQKLIVKDRRISSADKFITLLSLGFILAFITMPEIPRLAYLALASILVPIVIYAFSPVPQIVLEYRVYFSVFGIAILACMVCQYVPYGTPLMVLQIFGWIILSEQRNRLYRDPVRFWRQASLDCPDRSVKATYAYYLSRSGRTTDAAELLTDKLVTDLIQGVELRPTTDDGLRLTLINLARAYVGPLECHEDLDPVKVRQAITLVEEVTRVWPDSVDGWRNLGALWYARASVQERVFDQIDDPSIAEVRRKNFLNYAIENFSRAVNLDANDGPSWFGLGCAHMDQGSGNSLEYAKSCLLTAVDRMPTVEAVRVKLIELLHQTQDPLAGVEHIHYLKGQGLIYVTDDMLPEHIRNRS